MQKRIENIIKIGSQGFSDRSSIDSLWQSMALNFYPERATFTNSWSLGEEFASHLTTSYPILARRDLSNAIKTMLRPRGKNWFSVQIQNMPDVTGFSKQYLEYVDSRMRMFMFNRTSGFDRATNETDSDYATFGNAVFSIEYNQNLTGLLFRSWHLKDLIWFEDHAGNVDEVHRNWEETAENICYYFGDNTHSKVKEAAKKDPTRKIKCRHVVISTDKWEKREDGKKYKLPYVSIWIDTDNNHVMEETPTPVLHYVIPRWQTISGSQYAYSPATVCALPDARLIQSMSLTLLEAGEKAVNPPIVATSETVRSDVNMHAGGITWIDYEYDERLGDALRPMSMDKSGLAFGVNIREETKAMIQEAFFLNKLALPQQTGDMTATEVSQRIEEYIRGALPLFQSIETEYNANMCEMVFDLLNARNAFGSFEDVPEELQGKNIEFTFESPLIEAEGREKGQRYLEAANLLRVAAEMEPSTVKLVKNETALRDTFTGIKIPEKWLHTEEEMEEIIEQETENEQQQKQINMIAQTGQAAQEAGKGAQAITGE